MTDPDAILRRHGEMAGKRGTFETHWQEVTERVLPRQDNWFGSVRAQGDKRTEKIYDSTAVLALGRFAAAMESILTPRAEMWHRLVPEWPLEETQPVREWLEEISKMLFRVRYAPRSNFASQMHEFYMGLGSIGTACLFVDDDPGRGVRYRNLHMSGVYLCEDHQGMVDTVHRVFRLTHRQAVQMFGADALPERIREGAEKKPDEDSEFLHAVFPSTDVQFGRLDFEGMPYRSIYISVRDRKVVQEGGYWEFPYMLGRYVLAPGEVYGRSVAMDALPDIKVVNEMEKTILRTGQRAADPPLLAADDGVLGAFQIRPGAIIQGGLSISGQRMIEPLVSGANFPITLEMANAKRQVINDHFLVTLFQILAQDRSNMTATEVLQRAQEKGALLAPAAGRQQSECLGPMIQRELGILARAGALPPPPPEWMQAGGEYKVEYNSEISRAQKAGAGIAVLRTIEGIAPLAQYDPSVMDRIDADEAVRVLSDSYGVPSKVLRSDEEVQAIREQRDAQASQQAALQAAPVAASAARDLAQASALAGVPGGALLGAMGR